MTRKPITAADPTAGARVHPDDGHPSVGHDRSGARERCAANCRALRCACTRPPNGPHRRRRCDVIAGHRPGRHHLREHAVPGRPLPAGTGRRCGRGASPAMRCCARCRPAKSCAYTHCGGFDMSASDSGALACCASCARRQGAARERRRASRCGYCVACRRFCASFPGPPGHTRLFPCAAVLARRLGSQRHQHGAIPDLPLCRRSTQRTARETAL